MKTARKLNPAILVLLLVLAFAAEAFMGNYSYLINNSGDCDVRDYRCDSLQQIIEINGENDYFIIDDVDFKVGSVSFIADATRMTDAKATVYAKNSPDDAVFFYVAQADFSAEPFSGETTVYLGQAKDYDSLYIAFSDFEESLNVWGVTLNKSEGFGFNILRFAIMVLAFTVIYCLSRFGLSDISAGIKYSDASFYAIVFSLAASLAVMALCMTGDSGAVVSYPFVNGVSSVNPYYQQFDAFMKGQLHLDVEPSAELLALANPYDPAQRNGVDFLWDRALFDGKYYSYFGVAPIILVFFPFYLVTGMLPSLTLAMGIFSAITAVFFSLAVIEYAKLRKARISPFFAAFLAFSSFLASATLLIQRGRGQFYYLASIAAMAFAAAFIFFIFKAFTADGKKRYLFYALAGISFGLGFHSRVNTMLPLAIVSAVFVLLLLAKRIKEKQVKLFAGEALALGLPVVTAVALSMLYNQVRFGSPFDFGTAYQLTVADTSLYELNFGGILPSVYHYFLQPFEFSAEYPFLKLQNVNLGNYGRYVYVDSGLGIFAFPFNLLLLACPFVFRSKRLQARKKIVYGAALASLFVTAFADFCLGGVIFRYTADISLLAAILAAVTVIEVSEYAWDKLGEGGAKMFKYGISILAAATFFVAAVSTLTQNANLSDCSEQLYGAIENITVFWK